jgi:uncharacterized integral membrane protein
MQLGVIFGLIFGLVIAFFAFLNTESVSVNYFFGRVETSVALLVLAAAIFGALTVGLLGLLKQIATGFAVWDYKNKSRRLAREVEALKSEKSALSDDLSFLQAEYGETVRRREEEHREAIRKKEEECARAVKDKEVQQGAANNRTMAAEKGAAENGEAESMNGDDGEHNKQ